MYMVARMVKSVAISRHVSMHQIGVGVYRVVPMYILVARRKREAEAYRILAVNKVVAMCPRYSKIRCHSRNTDLPVRLLAMLPPLA